MDGLGELLLLLERHGHLLDEAVVVEAERRRRRRLHLNLVLRRLALELRDGALHLRDLLLHRHQLLRRHCLRVQARRPRAGTLPLPRARARGRARPLALAGRGGGTLDARHRGARPRGRCRLGLRRRLGLGGLELGRGLGGPGRLGAGLLGALTRLGCRERRRLLLRELALRVKLVERGAQLLLEGRAHALGGNAHRILRRHVVGHGVLEGEPHVIGKVVDGLVLVRRELLLHRAEVHGLLDDVEVVRDLERNGVHRDREPEAVRVLHERRHEHSRLLHLFGIPRPLLLLRQLHQV
mmetsp:Transcript_6640/g.18920  ORF Transcript_6640/g.18920 Transcript_6640/m.18920 type:complete len:296 (-) Transcript_6640:1181-2068(-)